MAKAHKDKKQLLIFATVAQRLFKEINGKYVLTQTPQFKSTYYPNEAVTKLFTPDFKLVSTYENLLKRARVQAKYEAALKQKYWSGTIVKKVLEVPYESEAHHHLYAGSVCYLWIPEYREKKKSNKSVEKKFNQYYQDWKKETHLSEHSDTGWYTSRPSFRKIVGLGMDVLPLLEKKLKEDKLNTGGDFFLAFAVVEICGWNKADFYSLGKIIGEQGFRDNVLKKLDKIKSTK